MHDEVMALFDDCIERMLQIRGRLAAGRRVHPGERRVTVLAAVEVAEHFVAEATRTVCPAAVSPPAIPAVVSRPAAPPVVSRPAAPAAVSCPATPPSVSRPAFLPAMPASSAVAGPRPPEPVSAVDAAPVASPRSTLSPAR